MGLALLTLVFTVPRARAQEDTQSPPPAEDAEPAEASEAAEEQRTAEARALFAAGVAHAQQAEWAQAVEVFEQARERREAPAILYNLAAALVEVGRYREASQTLEALEQNDTTDDGLRQHATELRARIAEEAGVLTIRRAGATANAAVHLDEELLEESWLSRGVPVAPGTHVVTAIRGTEEIARTEVSIEARTRTSVLLDVTERVTVEERIERVEGTNEDVVPLAVGLGVGGAVLIAGIIVTAVLVSDANDRPPVIEGNFLPAVLTWP